MYVRLAFAVAAHLEPEILIVDEVLAVGDAEFQKKCLGKLSEVATEGRTVLFVSHQTNAVQRLCEKVMLLKNGKVAEIGNCKEVLANYIGGEGASVDWQAKPGESNVSNDYFDPTRFAII